MFDYPIDILPPFTEGMRNRICKDSNTPGGDKTLFMTLTTLFYKRIPNFKFYSKVYDTKFESCEEHMTAPEDDMLKIFWFPMNNSSEPKLTKEYKSFPKHETFLTKSLGQNIYIRVFDDKTAAIFYERFEYRLYHSVQALIYVLFGEYFKDQPLTEDERNLLVSLTKSSDSAFKKEIQNLLLNEDLKHFLLKSELIGMEKSIRERRYNGIMSTVNGYIEEMQQSLERYRKAYEHKMDYEAMAYGLKAQMDAMEEHTEFEDYLCENKLLTNIEVKDGKISFIVKTFVNPYLPDDWDSLSRQGYIFRDHARVGNCLDDEANLKLLLDAIFSKDHTLKLRICGFISLDYYGSHATSVKGYNYTANDPTLKDYVPNAHLNRHNCFGRNMDDILSQLGDGDLIGAVECSINVVKRINVAESASFDPFVDYIKSCRGKCIVTEDGQELTAPEAVTYLKEKNNEASSNTTGEADVA